MLKPQSMLSQAGFASLLMLATATVVCNAATLLDPMALEKYVDPLPNLLSNLMAPVGTPNGATRYEVTISQFTQRLHSNLEPTTLWGYNGTFPGPTFLAERGERIEVRWINRLVDDDGRPLNHLLPYDATVHGASAAYPQARTVTHMHGAITDAQSDGFPEHWVTPDPNAPANGLGGPAGNSQLTSFYNEQPSTTLWYHDHAMGITRLNVYAGMAGLYILRDDQERSLNLPSDDYEIPLLIQDRSFYDDGQLFYPYSPMGMSMHRSTGPHGDAHEPQASDTAVVPHFLGNTNLVNGVVWPYLEVEPRKYRFRILNGANSRFYDLALEGPGEQRIALHQIGTDGGLLPQPVERVDVLLAPSERADVVVDFSALAVGDEIHLRNFAPDEFTMDHASRPADPHTTGQVMLLRVVPATGPDTSLLPEDLAVVRRLEESDADRVRHLELIETKDHHGRPLMLLDGKHWSDPATEIARLGETEIWEIENFTSTPHPIHLHSALFQLLERVDRLSGRMPLAEHELGWEDTVIVNPRELVRIIVPFEQFSGTFVWHCHMLEHEDHEMMRPLVVVPEPSTAALGITCLLLIAMRRFVLSLLRRENADRTQR